ncbi:MAG TPA: hypothetical protein VI564_04590 [Candidatus Nanoarchaeia archaeon]|nr:hypothetical protein [Candidatus Nanoarchaeia archaeon]
MEIADKVNILAGRLISQYRDNPNSSVYVYLVKPIRSGVGLNFDYHPPSELPHSESGHDGRGFSDTGIDLMKIAGITPRLAFRIGIESKLEELRLDTTSINFNELAEPETLRGFVYELIAQGYLINKQGATSEVQSTVYRQEIERTLSQYRAFSSSPRWKSEFRDDMTKEKAKFKRGIEIALEVIANSFERENIQ